MAEERGWAFPVQADKITGRIQEVTDEEMVRQSIRMILSTSRRERYLHPDFGCDLYTFMFGSTDYTSLKQMEKEAERSILAYEKRICDLTVRAEADQREMNRVNLEITYKLLKNAQIVHFEYKVDTNV